VKREVTRKKNWREVNLSDGHILLTVEEIYTYYGLICALQGVSLNIAEGEAVALIGPNGAGKTTLLQTISGTLRPKKGDILFEGRSITKTPPHEIVRRGIVQVPEGRQIYPHFTVLENLKLGAYVEGNGLVIKDRLEMVFSHFPRLKERLAQKAGTLSGGEQQMLAIARGLMAGPKLLLLDEPSLGLSPQLVDETMDIIKNIHLSGTTILLVDQNAYAALEIAKRAYIIEGGRIIMHEESATLLSNEEVRKKYFGG
jgi:branched-chain amino acid transport system ATP-binding protein